MNNSPYKTTLQYGADWLNELRLSGRSPKTIATYEAALINVEHFLRHRGIVFAQEVRPPDLTQWQKSLDDGACAAATHNAFTRIVTYWFTWQWERGLIFGNPAAHLVAPKVPMALPRCLTHADIIRVVRCTSGSSPVMRRDRALLELAYATGARLNEIVALDVTSLALTQRLVRLFGKGKRERIVPLTHCALRALFNYIQARRSLLGNRSDHAALFLRATDGSRLHGPGVAEVFARAARRANLPLITPHDFRRTFATQLIRYGAHPAAVAEMLGHRGFRHLPAYIHPDFCSERGRRALG